MGAVINRKLLNKILSKDKLEKIDSKITKETIEYFKDKYGLDLIITK